MPRLLSAGQAAAIALGCAAAILIPALAMTQGKPGQPRQAGPASPPRTPDQKNTVMLSNARQLSTVLLMYQADYDDRLPLAASWVKSAMPYTKSKDLLVNPNQPKLKVGFALNKKMSGVAAASIKSPAETVLIFTDTLASACPSGGPEALYTPSGQAKGAVGFADGHVKTYASKSDLAKVRWNP